MTADLRQRIADAIRTAAYDCPGDCGLTETECDARHPIQVAAQHFGMTASVYADIDPLAAAVAAEVQPELDQLRAELDRTRAELATARDQLRAIALIRVWRNEDGREFMFADDIRTALNLPTSAASAPTTT